MACSGQYTQLIVERFWVPFPDMVETANSEWVLDISQGTTLLDGGQAPDKMNKTQGRDVNSRSPFKDHILYPILSK